MKLDKNYPGCPFINYFENYLGNFSKYVVSQIMSDEYFGCEYILHEVFLRGGSGGIEEKVSRGLNEAGVKLSKKFCEGNYVVDLGFFIGEYGKKEILEELEIFTPPETSLVKNYSFDPSVIYESDVPINFRGDCYYKVLSVLNEGWSLRVVPLRIIGGFFEEGESVDILLRQHYLDLIYGSSLGEVLVKE